MVSYVDIEYKKYRDAIHYLNERLQRMNDLHNELDSTPPGSLPPASTSFHPLTLTPYALSFRVKEELCPSCQAPKGQQARTKGRKSSQHSRNLFGLDVVHAERVDEVSGIQHTLIRNTLISPSSGLVGNKRGLHSVVYGSKKSKLPAFSSRCRRESMREDSHSHSEIMSPICLANQCEDDDDLFCGKFFKDKKEMSRKLMLHAVSQSFEFSTIYSDTKCYVLSCVGERCSWSFRAKSVKGSQSFVVRQEARNDHGVVISYSKAWRCQEHSQGLARGTPDDSFEALPSCFHMLKEKNPGYVTFIEVDSVEKFKYAFLSFGPSIRGFKLMKKVLSIDDSENAASWSWFMMCLKTIVPDEEDFVFVSDRASSIEAALLQYYPLAHHGICIFHFEKNVLDKHKSSTLIPLVVEADYLTKADIRKWSRAYAPANRFNIMTSNLSKSINSLLKESREFPIVCLFETIRMIMTRWFTERREEGVRHIHPVTVKVVKKMKQLYDLTLRWLEVSKINDSEFEVKGDTREQVVNFETRHCSCLVFDVENFPCAHAIAAAKAGNKHENNYVDEFFSNERYTLAYSESIYPVGDKAYWNFPSNSFLCLSPSIYSLS
ncbi:hypothetical protein Bca4012_084125 [Brassica carinata]